MRIVAQSYRDGSLALLDVPEPSLRPGGVLVRTQFSAISIGTELMKVAESKLTLLGKARARPDQVKKVLESVAQQGLGATLKKVRNRLDTHTPLGYSLCGVVKGVGVGVDGVNVGDRVSCSGNQFALHADVNWIPKNMFVRVPDNVRGEWAAFGTVGSIALQGVRQAEIRLGEVVCVIGLGLIGQMVVQLLVAAGARVVGFDLDPERCAVAERAGAIAAATPDTPAHDGAIASLRKLTDARGADVVMITAGGRSNQPVELAGELARDRARIVDVGKCSVDLPWNVYYEKEIDFRFSRSYGPGRYDRRYEEDGIDYPAGYVRWTQRRIS